MRQKSVGGFQQKLLRQECAVLLGQRGTRLTLIFSIMVCVSPLLLFISVSNAFEGILIPQFGTPMLLLHRFVRAALILFFALPLWMGMLSMAARAESGEQIYLSEVFGGFARGRAYRSALRASWRVYWPWLILFGGLRVLVGVWEQLPTKGVLVGFFMVLAGVFLILLWLLVAPKCFLGVYLAMDPSPEARRMRPYARSLAFGFIRLYLPWLLLSVLTVGILLLADVLPQMSVAYFRLCRRLKEKTTQSEDLINE